MDEEILLSNIDKIHTTPLGLKRIKSIFSKLDACDVVQYCKNMILNKGCKIYKQGKNYYCEIDSIRITINASSYTIITAHLL